ncbi:DUF6441 family protein [Brevundimonas diminuta]|uniref:DUF6441 family protein n=1 Tax=Brevundimonas diminuta TaxID=293 RepID=UPI0022B07D90|nr:DUF6441 family protein [Brevundimonas diminuta]MCZ4109538.1 DUF6441 family protein [Brevundimonas diminuta]
MNLNGVQLRAALTGDFDKEVDKGLANVETALQAALFDYAVDTQAKWRQDVAQSGLRNAQRLTKTIRVRKYKNSGLNPAAQVFSTFPILQRAFEQATVVRSPEGHFLLIPNPDVWPNGRVVRPSRNGGQRTNTLALAEQRFGKLRLIYRPGKAGLLVAEARSSASRPGTFKKASATALRTGRGLTTIVVFYVVKEARLPRMLRGSVIRDRARANASREIDRRFIRYFQQGSSVPLLTGPSND